MAWKAESTPKKKKARIVVMITTIIAVETVSLRVGQTILADSARTWRRKSVGLTLATSIMSCRGQPPGTGGPVSRAFADACERWEIASEASEGKGGGGGSPCAGGAPRLGTRDRHRSVAQLVEHRSPKPRAGGSNPSSPANPERG